MISETLDLHLMAQKSDYFVKENQSNVVLNNLDNNFEIFFLCHAAPYP